MVSSKDQLVKRLNRVIGQIEGLKRKLENDNAQCENYMIQIKAANNALKKFGEAYVGYYFHNCLASGASEEDIKKTMNEVISSAFQM